MKLERKNIVLTGASGILGKKFAEKYLREGANLALVDRDENSLLQTEDFLRSINSDGRLIKSYLTNIADEKEITNLTSNLIKDFSQIDVLHNNAASKGQSLDRFFDEFVKFDLETWREIMATNVDACFLLCKHIGGQMVQSKVGGSIIQTSSIYGELAPDQRIYEGSLYMGRPINSPAIYTVSKAALNGLTKYLAAYWGKDGIRVNSISPGGVESGQNEEFKRKYSARIPMGRMCQADELMGVAVFLASDDSTYVTGQNIFVDGGLSVW